MKKLNLKKTLCIALCSVVATGALWGCSTDSPLTKKENLLSDYQRSSSITTYDFTSSTTTQPENYEEFSASVTEFSIELLKSSMNPSENTLVAPQSTATTLSLLLSGASSSTGTEIKNLLAPTLDMQSINNCNYYLSSRLSAFNSESTGYFSENSLWFEDKFDVKAAYLQNAANYYSAHIVRTKLAEDDTVDKINTITADSTCGAISSIITDMPEGATTISVTAAALADNWITPYTSDRVKEGTFHGSEKDSTVSFMTSNERYISESYATGFIKSLKDTPVKFAAIMPTEDMSLEEFAETLTANRLSALLLGGKATNFCTASIPCFDAEAQAPLDSTLKEMGINKAYSKDDANFGGISASSEVYLSSALFAAQVSLSPNGTTKSEAAAPIGAAEFEECDTVITLDRPFIYIFFDNESGIPVLMGCVNNL